MTFEPEAEKQHIFSTHEDAQAFYDALCKDETLTEDILCMWSPPRQSHHGKWIVDRIERWQ
jgi:hypothetical protein